MVQLDKLPISATFVPAEQSDSPWLVIGLHGSHGSAEDFAGLESYVASPKLNYLYLNGPIPSYGNYSWYTDLPTRDEAHNVLQQVFDALADQGYPKERIFLIGFSQGAALAFEADTGFAGIIGVSGRIEDINTVLRNKQQSGEWLVTHGLRDTNLSIDVIRQQIKQLQDAGFRIDYHEFDKAHEFESTQELPLIGRWLRIRCGLYG